MYRPPPTPRWLWLAVLLLLLFVVGVLLYVVGHTVPPR